MHRGQLTKAPTGFMIPPHGSIPIQGDEMNISSKSWHLRLVRFLIGSTYKPASLCPYFWTVVWCVSPLFFPLLIMKGYAYVDDRFGEKYPNHEVDNSEGEAGWRIFLAFFWVLTIPVWGVILLKILLVGVHKAEHKPPKESNLFAEWLRAKKGKVCPLITVVEESK